MSKLTWVVEPNLYPYERELESAIRAAGDYLIWWEDDWWRDGVPQYREVQQSKVFFYGSLGNANQIGSTPDTHRWFQHNPDRFNISCWGESRSPMILNHDWHRIGLCDLIRLVGNPEGSAEDFLTQLFLIQNWETPHLPSWFDKTQNIFIRPDGPGKEFSGRVLPKGSLNLAGVDFGYHFEDENLPVIIAPAKKIGREWRTIVRKTPDGSLSVESITAYRTGLAPPGTLRPPHPDPNWADFEHILDRCQIPADLFVADFTSIPNGFNPYRLVEFNPISGSDLHGLDPARFVEIVRGHFLE